MYIYCNLIWHLFIVCIYIIIYVCIYNYLRAWAHIKFSSYQSNLAGIKSIQTVKINRLNFVSSVPPKLSELKIVNSKYQNSAYKNISGFRIDRPIPASKFFIQTGNKKKIKEKLKVAHVRIVVPNMILN